MKRALIVVNLAGFLNFLWHDIETLQYMGYKVSVAMNGKLMDGSYAVEIPILKEKGIDYFQIDFDTKSPLAKENVKAYKQLSVVLKNNKYDLVHCHTPIAGVEIGRATCREMAQREDEARDLANKIRRELSRN